MKAVIFDLDGVVVNTAKYHYLAWKKLAGELGFDFDIRHNERLKGVSRMESLNIVLEVGGITGYSQEFLDKIRNAGYKAALGSASKSGGMILRKLGLESKFDVIVDGNLVEKPKPDPEVFVKGAQLLNIPCEECIVVEDAKAGVEAAHAGHMKCIGIGDPMILGEAEKVVNSTEELVTVDLEHI